MHASAAALKLIKDFEGLRLTPYRDGAGFPTIGYGHKILKGESFILTSAADAENLLRGDISKLEQELGPILGSLPLTQNQYDALVSFAFNLGCGSLKRSTLLRMLEDGDPTSAIPEFEKWIQVAGKPSEGLLRRRRAEAALFSA